MGLLDDAIREHLDLKRRRGADPGEIERAEREALGPVRRGPDFPGEDAAPVEAGADPQAEQPAQGAEQWERFDEDPELHALEEDELGPHEAAQGPEGDPLMEDEDLHGHAPEATPPAYAAEPSSAADVDAGPAPHPADPPSARPAQHVDRETEEYELEPAEEDDDVLETTPEFLQDAPDHDRLWFEQRPPRDFDFDG